MTARTKLLAYIYIAMCGGCLVAGVVLLLGLLLSRDANSNKALEMIGSGFVVLSVSYFIPGLLGGFGLLRGRPWARVVIIVLSVLVLFAIPIGTALGGFGLWVLLASDTTHPPVQALTVEPKASRFRAPTFSTADKKRYQGLLLAAAGVAAGFVVMIGTGYRVTGTPGSPISDALYFSSIGVFVLVAVVAVRIIWFAGASGSRSGGSATQRREQQRLEEEYHRKVKAQRRRLELLAKDPVRRTYAERIQRGESWSDAQIEYDLITDTLATCEHLRPIEREMRAAGIQVRLMTDSRISARCRVDPETLRTRFSLPPFVDYAEPQSRALSFDDPLPAMIACAEHGSAIQVVHRIDATRETPMFPSTAATSDDDPSLRTNPPTDRFIRLRSRILHLAKRIDAPAQLIPTHGHSVDTGLPHIEIDGDTYHYVRQDRGQEYERFSTTSEDELLYRVFLAVAFSMAATQTQPYQKPGEDLRRETFKRQLALLGRLNPEWATRCAAEHQEVLAEHQFVDKAGLRSAD